MMISSLRDFGCVGDGVADDTANAQKAINGCGGILYIDPGVYFIPGGVKVSDSICLQGFGQQSAFKVPQSCPIGLDVQTTKSVVFKDFAIIGDANVTNWSILLNVAPSSGFNQASRCVNLYLACGGIAANMANAAWWVMDSCFINQPCQIGLNVGNWSSPDAGDSTFCNGIISCPIGGQAYAINQVSSGGLRIVNSKVLGGIHGLMVQLSPGVTTSDLIVVGNSFELNGNDNVAGLQRDVGHFNNVVVVGNQMWRPGRISFPNYGNMVVVDNAIST
jgi:Pectate lyase superfamily protein